MHVMGNQPDNPKELTLIEWWAQHVIQGLTIAVIGWFALQVTELKASNAGLASKPEALDSRIGELNGSMDDRFTGADANRAHNDIPDRTADHENQLRALESIGRICHWQRPGLLLHQRFKPA